MTQREVGSSFIVSEIGSEVTLSKLSFKEFFFMGTVRLKSIRGIIKVEHKITFSRK